MFFFTFQSMKLWWTILWGLKRHIIFPFDNTHYTNAQATHILKSFSSKQQQLLFRQQAGDEDHGSSAFSASTGSEHSSMPDQRMTVKLAVVNPSSATGKCMLTLGSWHPPMNEEASINQQLIVAVDSFVASARVTNTHI